MADGSTKPIEEIEVGDEVLSRPEDGDETTPLQASRVVQTFERKVTQTLLIELENGQKIETTDEHPFYVRGKGFVRAGSLQPDEVLAGLGSDEERIVALRWIDRSNTVYNFEVCATHTYFVSAGNPIWVHNAGCNIGTVADDIADWIGPGGTLKKGGAGENLVIISADGKRKARIDSVNPKPHQSPHAHLEMLVNGKWIPAPGSPSRIYPRDVPHR
jgi:hypothetical protein